MKRTTAPWPDARTVTHRYVQVGQMHRIPLAFSRDVIISLSPAGRNALEGTAEMQAWGAHK